MEKINQNDLEKLIENSCGGPSNMGFFNVVQRMYSFIVSKVVGNNYLW